MRPITIPFGVRGRVRWTAHNERGEREPVRVRYADGHETFAWGGHWSPNLITNTGMDAFSATNNGWMDSATTGHLRWWGRIGTGSTAPAFTDTALDNQVQASNTSTPFSMAALTGTMGTDEITIEALHRRTFVMTESRNLTEYGFSILETGNLNVRELFRDSGGTPITISLLSGKTLRLDHTFDTTLDLSLWQGSFDIEEYDATNTLVGTTALDYDARWWSALSAPGTPDENALTFQAAATGMLSGTAWGGTTGALLYSTAANPDITSGPYLGATPSGYSLMSSFNTPTGSVVFSRRAYTPGTHERVWDATINAAQGNWAWTGWGYRRGSTPAEQGGVIVAFRNDGSFAKADTHEMRWSLRYAWARA